MVVTAEVVTDTVMPSNFLNTLYTSMDVLYPRKYLCKLDPFCPAKDSLPGCSVYSVYFVASDISPL